MSNGRDENGRFTPGNPGGPGRPRRAIEAEYLAALSEVVTLDTWREIVTTAVERAKSGDARAREWIARYVLGSESTVLLTWRQASWRSTRPRRELPSGPNSIG